MADNHQSSSLSRAQVRALVAIETRLGVPPKYAKYVLYGLLLLALCSVVFLTNSLLFEDEEGMDLSYGSSSSSNSLMSGGSGDDDDEDGQAEEEEEKPASKSKSKSRPSADDDEEEEEEEGGGDGDGEEEEEDAAPRKQASSVDTSEKFKASQLKKFQDKDKTLMKFFSKFRKESEITAHFKELLDLYADLNLAKQVELGKTYEHRQVYAYELGKGPRSLLLVAGERGNEWAGSMALVYFATRLLQKYALTPQVSAIMNDLTLRIVPIVNPDGYAYHKSDWFMNRALDGGKKKHGVDVSQDFEAFTQLETMALRNYAKEHARELYGFVNVKCCTGSVSLPRAAICAKTEEEQMDLATRIAQAMGKGGKYKYAIRTEETNGDAARFAHRDLGLGLSFSLDVRQEKSTEDIVVTSQNVTMGLLELSKFILNEFPATKNMFGGAGAKPCVVGKASAREPAAVAQRSDDEEEDGEDEDEDASSKSFAKAKQVRSNADDGGDEGDELELSLLNANRKTRPNPGLAAAGAGGADPENSFLYFAYGPDMLYDVLLKAGLKSAWKVSNAKLSGYVYDYTYHSNKKWKSGVADMVKSPHSAMYGVVWRLDLSELPLLLAWQSASSESSPLAQKLVSVESASGEVYSCITFYVRKKMKGEDVLEKYKRFNPSRQYRNCVLKGAKANRLPLDYIEHRLKSRTLGPLFTDKVGSMHHRNAAIDNVCDPLSDL